MRIYDMLTGVYALTWLQNSYGKNTRLLNCSVDLYHHDCSDHEVEGLRQYVICLQAYRCPQGFKTVTRKYKASPLLCRLIVPAVMR